MDAWLQHFIQFLERTDTVFAIPLLTAGGGLMIFGWRMWRFCVPLTYMLIAFFVAHWLAPEPTALAIATGVAAVVGAVAYQVGSRAVLPLGGIFGAAFFMHLYSLIGLSDSGMWFAAAMGFIMGSGIGYLNNAQLVILLTSFQGALLLVGGLIVLLVTQRATYGVLESLASHWSFFGPFCVLVPAVISSFVQMAEVRRSSVTLARTRST